MYDTPIYRDAHNDYIYNNTVYNETHAIPSTYSEKYIPQLHDVSMGSDASYHMSTNDLWNESVAALELYGSTSQLLTQSHYDRRSHHPSTVEQDISINMTTFDVHPPIERQECQLGNQFFPPLNLDNDDDFQMHQEGRGNLQNLFITPDLTVTVHPTTSSSPSNFSDIRNPFLTTSNPNQIFPSSSSENVRPLTIEDIERLPKIISSNIKNLEDLDIKNEPETLTSKTSKVSLAPPRPQPSKRFDEISRIPIKDLPGNSKMKISDRRQLARYIEKEKKAFKSIERFEKKKKMEEESRKKKEEEQGIVFLKKEDKIGSNRTVPSSSPSPGLVSERKRRIWSPAKDVVGAIPRRDLKIFKKSESPFPFPSSSSSSFSPPPPPPPITTATTISSSSSRFQSDVERVVTSIPSMNLQVESSTPSINLPSIHTPSIGHPSINPPLSMNGISLTKSLTTTDPTTSQPNPSSTIISPSSFKGQTFDRPPSNEDSNREDSKRKKFERSECKFCENFKGYPDFSNVKVEGFSNRPVPHILYRITDTYRHDQEDEDDEDEDQMMIEEGGGGERRKKKRDDDDDDDDKEKGSKFQKRFLANFIFDSNSLICIPRFKFLESDFE